VATLNADATTLEGLYGVKVVFKFLILLVTFERAMPAYSFKYYRDMLRSALAF
jgi:Na+-transporting methylmalonyl-CoA/oxaloacetate decarboxylase gamma subunit